MLEIAVLSHFCFHASFSSCIPRDGVMIKLKTVTVAFDPLACAHSHRRCADRTALASINRVRIVHGHGMGILKRAISELLERNPHVSRFYSATPAEGGTGATIAELRE